MLEFIRDAAWQFVGIVISAAISIGVFRAQRTRRELSFGVLSARTLITVHNSLSTRVEVMLDGRPVKDASLIVFAVKNSGNVPIRESDFQKPIEFRFGKLTSLLSIEVARTSPGNLAPELQVANDAASLSPLLLNPGDHIVFQALIAGSDHSVAYDGRLEGISAVSQLTRGAAQESKDLNQRLGGVVLGLPLRSVVIWFVINVADAVFGLKLVSLFTLNGSLAFGVISIALVTSVLEEAADYLKSRLFSSFARTVDDA